MIYFFLFLPGDLVAWFLLWYIFFFLPGDLVAWIEAYLREMDKKHREEWEILLTILQDPGLEELKEVATTMSAVARQERLIELKTKRKNLQMEERGM